MNRNLCIGAFAIGAAVIAWVGFGYLETHAIALVMTLIIALAYLYGALEMLRFSRETQGLLHALSAIPQPLTQLGEWLANLPPVLQNPVRLRIEGERAALPGPVMAPYLVGLLVMLGMLGTFLGMVVTLNGAVLALESTTDLQTIRASLAAPVKGLGLAFGTSVAGVTASAMLGLISALCRRERLQAVQQLDRRIAGELRLFSREHQRQENLRAVQAQSAALPALVTALEAMTTQMGVQHAKLNEELLTRERGLHETIRTSYDALAHKVGASLEHALSESIKIAGTAIEPVVTQTMAALREELSSGQTAAHAQMTALVTGQLEGVTARLDSAVTHMADAWSAATRVQTEHGEALAARLGESLQGFSMRFEQEASALLSSINEAQAAQARRETERMAALAQSLDGMLDSVQQTWSQAGEQGLAQQQEICRVLETTAQEMVKTMAHHAETQTLRTIDEMARLMQTATEAPQKAAEVIGQLQEHILVRHEENAARDHQWLEERGQLVGKLSALMHESAQAVAQQQAALEAMTQAGSTMLERTGEAFSARVEALSSQLDTTGAQVLAAAVEVSSLGEAMGESVNHAVKRFAEANEALLTGLGRVEEALNLSAQRSDDQLAFYVAQARELVDLCVLAQQRVLEELRGRLAVPQENSANDLHAGGLA